MMYSRRPMTIDALFLRVTTTCLVILVLGQLLAGCSRPETSASGMPSPRLPVLDLDMFVVDPPEPEPARAVQVRDPRSNWCEPLDQPFCTSDRECTDGSECVTPWWAVTGTETKVCARPMPGLDERRWRSARIRVYVDHVCRRADGCEPNDLHAYIRVLALRESTWRPWKRHRLTPDLEAAQRAWERSGNLFYGNPAAADPDRWGSGVGLLGQIPAHWLQRWDPMAPPETLCGEVEAVEAHLRAGREAVRKIVSGVQCDGRTFTGTAEGRPSWYDVSRVNSGSLCPGSLEHQEAFAARARRVGLDPWAPVTAADLGDPIPRDQQDAVAAGIRVRMDALPMVHPAE